MFIIAAYERHSCSTSAKRAFNMTGFVNADRLNDSSGENERHGFRPVDLIFISLRLEKG